MDIAVPGGGGGGPPKGTHAAGSIPNSATRFRDQSIKCGKLTGLEQQGHVGVSIIADAMDHHAYDEEER